jgi:hypothetical protein
MFKKFLFYTIKNSSVHNQIRQFEISRIFAANMSFIAKPKVFVTQPIPPEAYDILKQNNMQITVNEHTPLSRTRLIESIKGCDALFCTLNEKIDKEVLDSAGEQLKVEN